VPGSFFIFENDYKLMESNRIRLGLGNMNPEEPSLHKAFEVFEKALQTA
jgi:hypothetical protein